MGLGLVLEITVRLSCKLVVRAEGKKKKNQGLTSLIWDMVGSR